MTSFEHLSAAVPDDGTRSAARRDAAVSRLYDEHWLGLVRLAALMLDDVAAAEDVVQDAYTELYRRWDRLDHHDELVGYLRSTVLNRSRSVLRRRKVSRRRPPPDERPAGSAEVLALDAETRAEVRRVLAGLPVRTREVLVLRYWLDLPYAEIARLLGIGESTARATASRGVAALTEKLRSLR
jgi:RNA polymerase sigma-70 factor (sigma-E family)